MATKREETPTGESTIVVGNMKLTGKVATAIGDAIAKWALPVGIVIAVLGGTPAVFSGTTNLTAIKATTDARTLLDLGTDYETWDNATKAAYVARLNQISAGVR